MRNSPKGVAEFLNEVWNPKIADFGTVQLFPDDITNLSMSKSMVPETR